MRDGIKLATDVYGAESGKPKPVLLLRTPYNKNASESTARRYAAAGYAAVVQDARGRFQSGGEYMHYNNDGQDGFDTLEWISRQPWSNGRAGMWGASHPGAVQWCALAERPYGLQVLAPTATSTSLYRTAYVGGALRLALIAGAGVSINPPPKGITAPPDLSRFLLHLPLSEMDVAIGWPMPWLHGIVTHNRRDGFWSRLDVARQVEGMDVPAQHVVGYYDFFCREVVDSYQRLRSRSATPRARQAQQLILGPWDHGSIGQSVVAGHDFGQRAKLDVVAENLQWFDRFLKPATPPEIDFPKVRYFMMGRNEWYTAGEWPPAKAIDTPMYLHSGGKANTLRGDGRLSTLAPQVDEPPDRFKSDPENPIPPEPPGNPAPPRSSMFRPVDRAALEEREDMLVYTGATQQEPLNFAGPLRAELWVSADTPDADWVVKLVDVSASGMARGLAEGILRSSFRDSELHLALLEPGKTYRIVVDLGHVAASILPGHALRVEVAGSCFPMYDRNSNTGEGPFGRTMRISTQSLFHKPKAASRIVLPLIP